MTKSIGSQIQRISWHCALLIALLVPLSALADTWQLQAGAESPDRGRQALAFLPNEVWIHAGDSIRWTFPTHERHTLTFLKPGQTRPPGFGPAFGVLVGCPGLHPMDRASMDPHASLPMCCYWIKIRQDAPTYSVTFPDCRKLQVRLPDSRGHDRSGSRCGPVPGPSARSEVL